MRYEHLTTELVAERLALHPLLIPVGSIEQHGPHLPLSVDCDISLALCHAVAARLAALVAPVLSIGARSLPQSGGGLRGLPGTLYVRGEVMVGFYLDVLLSFTQAGARRIVLVNGHYENESFIFEAVAQMQEREAGRHVEVLALSWWSLLTDAIVDVPGSGFCGWHAEHASFVETSLMLHLLPELVRPERIDNPHPPDAGVMTMTRHSPAAALRGVLGRTTAASAEHGARIFEALCTALIERFALCFNQRAADAPNFPSSAQ